MEEAGLDTENMASSTAKLREEILALSGVDIMLNTNEFKSTYQIMQELAAKWQDLTDIQQATVTELIAGKRQGNIVSSLMNNFDIAEEALETSINSSGSAMREHEKWQQSLEAQILKLKAAWQGLSQSFLSSDFLKFTLNAVIDLVDGLNQLVDTFGALPALMGTIATGMSIFKGKGFFSILNKDVAGAQKQLSLFRKSFKDISRDMASGQGLFKSLFSKSITKADVGYITEFINQIKSGVPIGKAWSNTMTNASVAGKKMAVGVRKGTVELSSLKTATIGGKAALLGLEVAATAANMALTMGLSFAIQLVVEGIMKLVNAKKELAESVEEITSKFKEQSDELKKLKDDYDTSNESSMISKYEKLSKGVDNLGRNVSLTAEEYSEYQSVVNQIADQIPSLVSGYDSQGNAILSVKGNVEELTKAYENLIHTNNRKVLSNIGDIQKNFENEKEDANSDGWDMFWQRFLPGGKSGNEMNQSAIKVLEDVYSGKLSDREEIKSVLEGSTVIHEGGMNRTKIHEALKQSGVEIIDNSISKTLDNLMKTDPAKIKNIIDNYYEQFAEIVEQQKLAASALLSEAFDVSSAISGMDYGNISENLQAVAYQTINSLDYKDIADITEPYADGHSDTVEDWTKEMLKQLNSIDEDDNAQIESAFNLQTQFNNDEISYGEYIDGLKNVESTIDGLYLKWRAKRQLELSLGLDDGGIADQYDALVNRLTDTSRIQEYYIDEFTGEETPFDFNVKRDGNGNPIISSTRRIYKDEREFNITEEEAKELLDGLTAEEYEVAVDVITKLSDNDVQETVDQLQSAIEKELTLKGLTLDLKIDDVKADLEALATAMSESLSGSGLSSESLTAIENMFGNVSGYDPSKLFERTANGITLNTTELRRLNKEARKTNIDKINKEMDSLGDIYNQTKEELYSLTYGTKEYNDKAAELSAIEDRIKATEQLASQYEGLASAYQTWQMAEASGSQRDMYESMIEGFETVDDEISRGWLDDGSIEFLRLIKGENISATATTKELMNAYKSLDDTIKGTSYSIRDFFTVDEDGNSTNTGVYNFLDAIDEKFGGNEIVKRDKDGNIIAFDFQVAGGDKAIADALGISEELVQIMVRAADDAGFVISMDGTYQQLDVLKEKAQEAANKLKDTFKKTKYEFDLNTGNEETVLKDYNEALKIWEEFKKNKNKDGTVNMSVEGAEEAYTLVSTLQSMVDRLGEPVYMKLNATQVEKDMQTPLSKLQQYERLVQQEHQLKLKGTDTTELDKDKDELLDYFEKLSPEIKTQLGIEDDSREKLQRKLEAGEIEIPTKVDVQFEIDEKLGILVDKALYDAGLISHEEFTKRVQVHMDAEVDNKDAKDETENAVDEIVDEDKRKQNIEIIAEVLGKDDVNDLDSKLKGLDDKTIQAIAEVLGQVDVFKLKLALGTMNNVQVQAIAEAIGKGDVDGLKNAIGSLDSTTVQAIAEAFGYNDVNELIGAIDDLNPKTVQAIAQALGLGDVNTLQITINNMHGNTVDAKVNTDGQKEKISTLQSWINGLTGKIVQVGVSIANGGKKKVGQRTGADPAGNDSEVNGTANVNGTTGRAFKQGSWGAKNSGTALGGELGREILVRQGRWFTIGDNGAEFFQYKKGDIIFNHRQSEELLRNGKVTSGDGRAKALVGGTAFAQGTAFANGSSGWGGIGKVVSVVKDTAKKVVKDTVKKVTDTAKKTVDTAKKAVDTVSATVKSGKGSTGADSSGGTGQVEGNAVGKEADKFEETIDFVEIAISRIERDVDNLDKIVGNVYKSWSERNTALSQEIGKVREEIEVQRDAEQRYLQEAESVGLDEKWAERVREGTIDIYDENDFDEDTAEKIKEYQKW